MTTAVQTPAHRPVRLDFDTSPYFRSHLREPRGRGSWAFGFTPNPPIEQVVFAPGSMTLSEAKAWMRQEAARLQAAGTIPADMANCTAFVQP